MSTPLPPQSADLSRLPGTAPLQISFADVVFFDQHAGTEQYSLAHELGHYVLHIDRGSLDTLLLSDAKDQSIVLCRMNAEEVRDRNAQRKELQAERFAACILMPQDLMRAACADTDIYHWPNPYSVNVPPHRMRRLLRSFPRWTRPAQKLFSSQVQDDFCRVCVSVKLAATFAGMPPLVEFFLANSSTS